VRFHAVYWLALLRSAGLPLPTAILVHDYVTSGGTKISKSLENSGHEPAKLVAAHGCDAVRWWLLADVARVGDTEFSTGRLIERANTDLANGIGNLAHRFTGIFKGYRITPREPENHPLLESARRLPDRIDVALSTGEFRSATAAILGFVEDTNRLIAAEEPWRLRKLAQSGDGQAGTRLDGVGAVLEAACSTLAAELGPFLPGAADRLRRLLSGESLQQPLFPRAG